MGISILGALVIWVRGDVARQGGELLFSGPRGRVGLVDGQRVEAGGEIVQDVANAVTAVLLLLLLLLRLLGGELAQAASVGELDLPGFFSGGSCQKRGQME